MTDIIYKDYQINEYIFTVCLKKDYDGDVRVIICEHHLPPRNWWERLKQEYKIKKYSDTYWRPRLFPDITLKEHIFQELKDIIYKWSIEKDSLKQWEEFCK